MRHSFVWRILVCGLLAAGMVGAGPVNAAIPPDVQATLDELQKFSQAFAAVAAEVRPGVVTIFSEKVIRVSNPFAGTPFEDPFFRHFFQFPQQQEQRQQGLGSGVIVSEDGYILTNHHVVESADKILVELNDKRRLKARVVGADPKSDVAVLKIDAEGLPTVPFGNSDRLKVGDWVLAIGNPFGLQHTVTYGIVSAVGRGNVGLADYEDFIQTDAAINPGNSGGALVNLKGELVGINTAIATRSGGYQGIGFAIPVNMARSIMEQLVAHGKVRRGFLGVTIQNISPDMVEALGLKERKGVLVGGVEDNGPADKAGVKRGDIILAVNDHDVDDTVNLRNRIAQTSPGTTVRLKVLRDGRERTFRVKLGELASGQVASQAVSRREEALGWEVQELTPELAKRMGYDEANGVVMTNVQPGGVAYRAGLRRGDLVVEIDRQPIRSMADYTAAMGRKKAGDAMLILARRGRQTFFVALRIPG